MLFVFNLLDKRINNCWIFNWDSFLKGACAFVDCFWFWIESRGWEWVKSRSPEFSPFLDCEHESISINK